MPYFIIILIILGISIIVPYVHLFLNKKLKRIQKLYWALVVFWIAPIGAVLYFIFGRKPKHTKKKRIQDLDSIKVGKSPIFPYGGSQDE
jgi:hypothetical protein